MPLLARNASLVDALSDAFLAAAIALRQGKPVSTPVPTAALCPECGGEMTKVEPDDRLRIVEEIEPAKESRGSLRPGGGSEDGKTRYWLVNQKSEETHGTTDQP